MPTHRNRQAEEELDTSKIAIPPPAILSECPKFRVLVIGQSGVGKSSICKHVFNVSESKAGISHHGRGQGIRSVEREITFPGENENIILHDSGGFEAGDKDNIEAILDFIRMRSQQPRLADQIHCIWYCISCETRRPIQRSEEIFFYAIDEIAPHVPVIAVFTKFDALVNNFFAKYAMDPVTRKMNPNRWWKLANDAAVADYDMHYRQKLIDTIGTCSRVGIERLSNLGEAANMDENYAQGTAEGERDHVGGGGVGSLINRTLENLQKDGLKLLWIAAQKHDANAKVQRSAEEGMKVYAAASAARMLSLLPGVGSFGVYYTFIKVYSNIYPCWGLIDPEHLLEKGSIARRFVEGCFDTNIAGCVAYILVEGVNIFGPLTASLTAVLTTKIIGGVTLLMEDLFWQQNSRKSPTGEAVPLTQRQIEDTVLRFRNSQRRQTFQRQIDGGANLILPMGEKGTTKLLLDALNLARGKRRR